VAGAVPRPTTASTAVPALQSERQASDSLSLPSSQSSPSWTTPSPQPGAAGPVELSLPVSGPVLVLTSPVLVAGVPVLVPSSPVVVSPVVVLVVLVGVLVVVVEVPVVASAPLLPSLPKLTWPGPGPWPETKPEALSASPPPQ